MAKSIQASEILDIDGMAPERNISEEKYAKKEETEQRSLDIKYEKESELWTERITTLERNWTKAYANIFNQYCSQSIHISVMELPYYEYNIINDPLVMLGRIQHLTSSQIRETYPMM